MTCEAPLGTNLMGQVEVELLNLHLYSRGFSLL